MTDANQNFSKVVRLVDEQGVVVILKNNKPKYAVVDFSEYESFQQYRKDMIERTADKLIEENLEAFQTTVTEILYLQEKLIQKTGGLSGVRDMGLLASAVYRSMQSFGEDEVYPTPL